MGTFLETLRSALQALAANKLRSILTTIGVTIGVGAVIILVSIGAGVQSDISRQIMGLGSNLMIVVPGKVDFSRGGGGPSSGNNNVNRLTLDESDLVDRRGTLALNAVPIFQSQATVKFGNRSYFSQVLGTTPKYVPVRNFPAATGRFFTDSELSGNRKVVTLGSLVKEELFPNRDPVGETVTINGQRFTVIGVMIVKGGGFGINLDDQVFIPITTAQSMFGADNIGLFFVDIADADQIEPAKQEVTRILRTRLGEDDFSIVAQDEILSTFLAVAGTLTVALGGIAGISLLVGGIGIMNIMLVSVTERTREIGVRKAVGARTYHIMLQFVIEAVLLSLVGGVSGIALGWLGAEALKAVIPTLVTSWSVLLAFAFSAGVGVFFGSYPAYKASRLRPIEALRHE